MTLSRVLAIIGALAFAMGTYGAGQSAMGDLPSRTEKPAGAITFGTATVSLGMTVDQVQERLAGSARYIKFFSDKVTGLVYKNGELEGQVTFTEGRATYAEYQMPMAHSADELAQEVAGAVDSMETKTCDASNYSAHGTGGGFSQSIFECGSKTFNSGCARCTRMESARISDCKSVGSGKRFARGTVRSSAVKRSRTSCAAW